MQSYFNPAAYLRAKKNQDALQKSNPQNPVLKDEDEKFLERVTSSEEAVEKNKNAETTVIADDGEQKDASAREAADEAVVPEVKPELPPRPSTHEGKKERKDKGIELPSQEEAEAATRAWHEGSKTDAKDDASGEKRTWASYIPSISSGKKPAEKQDSTAAEPDSSTTEPPQQRTWTQYASAYVPSVPSLLSKKPKEDSDSEPSPIYNADGTIDTAATQAQQEKEISVLLDNLNTTTINDRVFALSSETQKIFEQFAQVLKDTLNGVPTAYEDMDKLLREAGPTLEKQFKAMPPFVQTLVKSLPAKLGAGMVPELLAASGEKVGADGKAAAAAAEGSSAKGQKKNKTKRRISGLKGLIKKEGAVAGILRSVVSFIQTRFPFLASASNVVMSLAVFILMFVFWYCHKRGREVRLAKDQASEAEKAGPEEDSDDLEVESTDEDDENDEWERKVNERVDPVKVPLPSEEKGGV